MNNDNTITFFQACVVAVVAAIFTGLVIFTFLPKGESANQLAGTSPQGSTFGDPKVAAVAVNLASPGANATSSSILNTDSNDRFVTGWMLNCANVGTSKTAYTGAGLANLTMYVGTTSASAPATTGATTAFWTPVISAYNVPTSTLSFAMGSSTSVSATSTLAALWPAGSYMTFIFNATNTAACTVGVNYIGS